MEETLNAFLPGSWTVYLRGGLDEATRDIVYSLRQHGRPTVALIFGGHWVVVDSVATEGDPSSGPFRVKTLWLHNPSPTARTTPPAIHNDVDVCRRGAPPDKVSWLEWKHRYLTAKRDNLWSLHPRFVVLSDPDDRTNLGSLLDVTEVRPPDIAAGYAAVLAAEYLKSSSSEGPEDPNDQVLHEIKDAKPGDPIRVTQPFSEEEELYYYLVPFYRQGKLVTTIKIDRGGRFRSLRVHDGDFLPMESSLSNGKKWIWLPSEQSKSPHLPFRVDHQVLDNRRSMHSMLGRLFNRHRDSRYVRVDGEVFSELTPLQSG